VGAIRITPLSSRLRRNIFADIGNIACDFLRAEFSVARLDFVFFNVMDV